MKPIPNFPGYYATKGGQVWSPPNKQHSKGKFLKPKVIRGGYLAANLHKKGKRYCKSIHRLVLETFVGPCPGGMECCHGNSVRTDNRLENLRWDTRSNNILDSVRHGTHAYNQGDKNSQAKLNDIKVRVIRRLLEHKYFTQKEIGRLFNVSQGTISFISCRGGWKCV